MIIHKAVWLPLLLAIGSLAKSDGPTVRKKSFDGQPRGLFFFDDTETAIVTEADTGRVWRTTDSGQEWERVEGLKEDQVYQVLHHPYNNKVAVALGRKRLHWYTKDHGETWRKFETPEADPSPYNPIGWHADDPERVLFNGQDRCDLWMNCVGKVGCGPQPHAWLSTDCVTRLGGRQMDSNISNLWSTAERPACGRATPTSSPPAPRKQTRIACYV